MAVYVATRPNPGAVVFNRFGREIADNDPLEGISATSPPTPAFPIGNRLLPFFLRLIHSDWVAYQSKGYVVGV